MKIERTKNAVKGTAMGVVQKIIAIAFPFIIRTIFIRLLGVEYLGLNSLFSSILQVLNLAELGVGAALVFSMYKPIAEDDEEKICALMNLYRHYYRIIGLVILVLGLVLVPFLRNLINGNIPSDINLYVIYLMNLTSTVLSYWLFAYRNSLFQAHQRLDVQSLIGILVNIMCYSTLIVTLLVFRNYYIYLSIQICFQMISNIVSAIASKKYYPMYSPKGNISIDERKEIDHKIRDLFTAKIGTVINHSTDSIVISAFLGLEAIAIYQNYYYIVSTIMAFFAIFFSVCTAGIGNSLIVSTKESNVDLFYNINHIVMFTLNFCCTSFLCLCQPFMKIWVGEDLMLGMSYVVLFCAYLFIEIAPRTALVFKDAGGIWRNDRFRPLTAALFNLFLNLVLVNVMGLYGIIISTVAALSIIAFPWLIHNINKELIDIGIRRFLVKLLNYILVMIIAAIVTYFICGFIRTDSIYFELLYKGLVCLIVPNLIFNIFFKKTNENKYMTGLILKLINMR